MRYYPRKIISEILAWVEKVPIIVIVGARQVGKTVLMELLAERLKTSGIEAKQIFYLDLEDLRNLEICSRDLDFFKRFLTLQGVDLSKKAYVFIDEIQHHKDPTNFMKLIADHEKNIQLIVSGSSALEMRKTFQEALTGRKQIFHLQTLNFEEYLIFKEEEQLLKWYQENSLDSRMKAFDQIGFDIVKPKLQDLAEDFIIFGGYPAVVKEAEKKFKLGRLNEIVQTYVKKDIKDFARIENVAAFNRLLILLAGRTGNLLNLSELSKETAISRATLDKYVFILENTFIIKLLTPYFTNVSSEVVKMPKIYFLDTGQINALLLNFNPLNSRADAGALAENFVFKQLYSKLTPGDRLHYWRNIHKNEVDFVLNGEPIEVKHQHFTAPEIPRSLRQFADRYQPARTIIVTKDYFYQDDKTLFLPFFLV
ncbi:MAG: ATP-binding protein [candidate division KSB1 bacterium]|nr:ATP-binding protein [candidate division KSB1 bacterium]MDZ7366649.1 ATP-binding protein [candidate division KSB1 bacterium]MDZ7404660.1 ATP-binding protein [candidate division KSB1 bacterium]